MTQPKDPIAGALELLEHTVRVTSNLQAAKNNVHRAISILRDPTIQANYLPMEELPEGFYIEISKAGDEYLIVLAADDGNMIDPSYSGQGPTPNAAFMDACGKIGGGG